MPQVFSLSDQPRLATAPFPGHVIACLKLLEALTDGPPAAQMNPLKHWCSLSPSAAGIVMALQVRLAPSFGGIASMVHNIHSWQGH